MMHNLHDSGMIYERLSARMADGLMQDIRFDAGFPEALFKAPGP